ncbi:ski oncogene-like isoform X2 [Gigantopelta aegis]|uniref:ski oncogene-like isoform X2 n=1 Tax=Gigantopelta aegis TaxID=1735272 RepID=UPI001B888CF6|nr:ski oncogene-like isoform X2 [Gigantopelta aegis]
MEQIAHREETLNPGIQRLVKRFQTSALRSLHGPPSSEINLPSSTTSPNDLAVGMSVEQYRKVIANAKKCVPTHKGMEYDPFLAPPPFPIQQMPVFTPVDTSRSDRSDTVLEGETISCFLVGGERRLCLPQILNTVLRDFTLQQINAVCDELHIFCSRCSPGQLDTLKITGILPLIAPSCGLVTKTDAERLCNALLHSNEDPYMDPPTPDSFKVYHECFGKCKGIFNPGLYRTPDSRCIQCVHCHRLFSPPKFVRHSHRALENRTCHWGFDSANWRSYLLLTKDQDCKEELRRMKARFDSGNKYKRKQSPEPEGCDEKRLKNDCTPSPPDIPWRDLPLISMSAFRPWSPSVLTAIKEGKIMPPAIVRDGVPGILPSYLHKGPPVLLNPERVIPYSESERYERHFTPNVSLAPPEHKKEDKSDVDDDDLPVSASTSVKKQSDAGETMTSPRTSKEYREYDLPTDTDDSSVCQSSPSDEEARFAESPFPESSLELELLMIRRALDGKVPNTKEAKDGFLHEFSKQRTRQEELLNSLIQTRIALKQELATQKAKVREQCQTLQKDLERLRIENEQLRRKEEIEVAKNQGLQSHIQHTERIGQVMSHENAILRRELQKRGVDPTDLLSGSYSHCNGNSSSEFNPQNLSPNRSSEEFKNESSSHHRLPHKKLSDEYKKNDSSSPPCRMPPKKLSDEFKNESSPPCRMPPRKMIDEFKTDSPPCRLPPKKEREKIVV